ncbi:Hypothetical_protein [Hexamita inflata]|uniref:Hypothetical_protein n=1 Tax=Hexamita inflata TaxID=28002 RepID=A0AA86R424_9EUKA|nr:Hypothetical protein HINF_LOCUS53392 [Hexamita inflata]
MLSYLISMQQHVTSMAEFNYCYNFIYEDPMGAGQIITGAVTFDDPLPRTLCNKTTNSIFRTTHTPVVQFRIDAEVDLASSNFSLFFMTMTDLVIQDSRVELTLKNGQHNDVRGILSCNTDFDLELFAVSVKIQYDALSAFYGLTFKMKTKLVLNQTKFEVSGTQTDTFFGLAHQLAEQMTGVKPIQLVAIVKIWQILYFNTYIQYFVDQFFLTLYIAFYKAIFCSFIFRVKNEVSQLIQFSSY